MMSDQKMREAYQKRETLSSVERQKSRILEEEKMEKIKTARAKRIDFQIKKHQELLKKNFERQSHFHESLKNQKVKEQLVLSEMLTELHDRDDYVERFRVSKSRAIETIRKLSRELQKDVERVKNDRFGSDAKSVSVEASNPTIQLQNLRRIMSPGEFYTGFESGKSCKSISSKNATRSTLSRTQVSSKKINPFN